MASNNQNNYGQILSYVADAAAARGIDPTTALRVFSVESSFNPGSVGDGGSSFGVPQLHYGGISRDAPHSGLGDEFTAETGLDARDPKNWRKTVDFALDKAKTLGWQPWTTTRDKLGIGNYAGIKGGKQVAEAPASSDFLTDFDVAPPAKSSAPAQAPVTNAAPSVAPETDFTQDFQIAPPGGQMVGNVAQPASTPEPTAPIGLNDAGRAFATGVPIIGGLLNKADAATNALLAPVLNPLFSKDQQLQGDTWSDRYHNALAIQQGMDADFAAKHPVANTALNIGGAVAGTIPAMVAAPAAFGVSKAPLAVNALASGLTGGAINAADAAVRSEGNLDDIQRAAEIGGAFGLAGPVAAKAIGAGVNALSNAVNRTTPAARNVANALSEIGMSPEQASDALARMGPNAALADIDPSLTTEAGGLASLGGASTSILKNAMATRAAGADNRVAQAIEQKLGPRPDITQTKEAVYDTAQKTAAPYYNAASAAPMDVTPVLTDIDAQMRNANGGERAVLAKAKTYLTDQKVGLPGPDGKPTTLIVPKDDPSALLKVRQQLDDDIKSLQRNGTIDGTSAGKSALRAASGVRSKIDAILKTDPNIEAGDAIFAKQMDIKSAVDEGSEIFKRGTRLPDFERSLAQKSPEELAAMRQGALGSVWDALDEARRGTLSGAQSMFAKASANRAKLDALFPKAGEVFDMLHGEAAMRNTEQRVAQNSATAERQAVQQKYAPSQGQGMGAAVPILGEAIGGGPGAAAAIGARLLYGGAKDALTSAARDRLIEGTARGLSSTGTAQKAFIGQLARAGRSNAVTNALASGAGNAANLLTRSGNALVPGLTVDWNTQR